MNRPIVTTVGENGFANLDDTCCSDTTICDAHNTVSFSKCGIAP